MKCYCRVGETWGGKEMGWVKGTKVVGGGVMVGERRGVVCHLVG